MSFRIGDWEFDHVAYDAEADVLYLSIGKPRRAVGEETPEGHVLLFDERSGEFCGVTLIGVRHIRETSGAVEITMPHRERVEPEEIDLALAG